MPRRILIVDDDKELCEELSEILKDAGFSADYIFDPLAGKVLLQNNVYDVLLLDIKMPRLNGFEFLKEIRDHVGRLKVFVISGNHFLPELLEEKQLSRLVAGVLQKPFDVDVLVEKIREATRP